MQIGLGTVQFGLDYGISNTQGKTSSEEVKRILDFAKAQKVKVLDTAALYGNSEEVLGSILSVDDSFQVVTKTPHFKNTLTTYAHGEQLKQDFYISLKKLNLNKIYALLIHNAQDLLAENAEYLFDAMQELKSKGLVSKVGVSVYSAEQIDEIMDRYSIDVIQLPVNVFDQRLVQNGKLSQLKKSGVEIHARSIFLQGLLLMKPDNLGPYFYDFKPHVEHYHQQLDAYSLTPLQAALAYAESTEMIDHAIVGVTNVTELDEIITSYESIPKSLPNWSEFACVDESIINPVNWQSN